MKIVAMTDGPLLLQGKVEIIDQNGKSYTHRPSTKCALCRCGGSSHKPFCDGTHVKKGFRSAPTPREPSALLSALNQWVSEWGGSGALAQDAAGREPQRYRPGDPFEDRDARGWGRFP